MSDGKAGRSLRMRFKRATKRAWELPTRPSNEKLLEMYALYKQATEGDCEGRARGGLRDRAKWKAWKGVAGTSEADAMERYCEIVDSLMV
ncbi:MAG: acyl-CoA-binding protein [Candidatus Poseidoniales archaeon]|uniref:acyl-CoA-binding protein n=1 Tax=Candidatus Thalassarchaeum betae TaxID=2599289 RepID=UPI001000E9D8|nr:acyl-CoA-binding protein [Candidatus Thalassoarchaea betae]RTZ93861.1 MAG: acyl-CoA-binding protein [Candidatus Poseidoniales archaeon]